MALFYHVPSETSDKHYTVRFMDNGEYRCDCPAFTFHKSSIQICKHIKTIMMNPEKYKPIDMSQDSSVR